MLAPDTHLGAYRLIAQIGAGGMGEVWKAEDTRLGRIVAIKILPPSLAADQEAVLRLRREARTAAQLNHPNIATIHSIEEADGRLFIVMEFVDGEPLARLIARGISEAELRRIGHAVAEALAEAHSKGIVHRDIKPDNIIVAGSRVKVLDFGIAKQVGIASSSSDAPTATFMTQQGMIVGTIHYMSPEQALGKPLDPRTDIFSFGVVLYEAATHQLPFRGETVTETMTQIIRDEPRDPMKVNPNISPAMAAIIQRCLRKNREERFANAAELARAFEAAPTVLTGSKLKTVTDAQPPARKKSKAGLVVTFGAIALVMGLIALTIPGRKGRRSGGAATAAKSTASAPAPAPQPAIPRAPSTATVNVATSAAATESAPVVTPPEVQPQPKPRPQPQPEPAAPTAEEPKRTAKQAFRRGEFALAARNFPKAIEEFQQALSTPEQLDDRQQAFAHLGLAIAQRDKEQAQQLWRDMWQRWPGDPDLIRVRREFGGMVGDQQRPFMRRRQHP